MNTAQMQTAPGAWSRGGILGTNLMYKVCPVSHKTLEPFPLVSCYIHQLCTVHALHLQLKGCKYCAFSVQTLLATTLPVDPCLT